MHYLNLQTLLLLTPGLLRKAGLQRTEVRSSADWHRPRLWLSSGCFVHVMCSCYVHVMWLSYVHVVCLCDVHVMCLCDVHVMCM